MTDTLPRAIPTDPAEQERLMPEWVKVEAARRWRTAPASSVRPLNDHLWHVAIALWQYMPEPVDPDEIEARSRVMYVWQHGTPDRESIISLVKLAIKRGRQLEREAKP